MEFDEGCFRLVASEIVSSEVTGVSAGVTNTLYFASVSHGNGDTIDVVYYWRAFCKDSTTSTPWTEIGAGNKARYSKDFSVIFTTFPTGSLSLSIEMLVAPTLSSGGMVTYTVRISNNFIQPVILDGLTSTLPAGFSYNSTVASSAITNNNSSLHPSTGATGKLVWHGRPLISYNIAASGTVTAGTPAFIELIFTANVLAIDGLYTNWVTATVGNMTLGPVSATVEVNAPTAVSLASFTATPTINVILVEWETATELDNLGFNLYRSHSPDSGYIQLNESLIAAQNPGGMLGATYTWFDSSMKPDIIYYYRLEDIDIHERRTLHGPITATVIAPPTRVFRLYLPLLFKPPNR